MAEKKERNQTKKQKLKKFRNAVATSKPLFFFHAAVTWFSHSSFNLTSFLNPQGGELYNSPPCKKKKT